MFIWIFANYTFCIILSVSNHSSTYPVNSLFKNQYLYQSSCCTIIKKQRSKLAFLFDFTQFVNTRIIMTFLNIWRFTHSMHALLTSGDKASCTDSPSPFFWGVLSSIWNEWWENWQSEVLSEWKVGKRKGYV